MPTNAAMGGAAPPETTLRRVVIAATIGNVLEWFDFVIYGFLAVMLAQVFFPTGDPTVSLLVTFGAFGLAYLVRPLGAIFVGSYTDKHGRKAGLTLSIALMMLGTTLMALTPGYAAIGIAAPVLITLARLLQGFSVGGEFGSSVAFLMEHGSQRRGFAASWQFSVAGLITALASLFGVALNTLLSHDQLLSWGWRLPYIFGMLVGPAGLYIRSRLAETPEFLEAEQPEAMPIRELLSKHPLALVLASAPRSFRTARSIFCCISRPMGKRRCTCRPIPALPRRWSAVSCLRSLPRCSAIGRTRWRGRGSWWSRPGCLS